MSDNELDILRDVSRRLESAGIAFMLTGSMAMNYYAKPRMTRDIDIVLVLDETQAQTLVRQFEADYYVDSHAVSRAIANRSMFNLIHNGTIIKVDCIVRKDDVYRKEEFDRRRRVTLGEFDTWIVSREDLILSKLHWARDSRSEMQLRDVRNLLEAGCDAAYLQSRAQTLGVQELLNEVTADSE